MIRKLSAFLILAFIGWGYLQAQEAKTCFKNMPDSICPLLSAVNRADFIDFLESKMKAEVTNSFGGKSEMTELSPDYIHVKMTPQSSWQMKLLSINDSTKVICYGLCSGLRQPCQVLYDRLEGAGCFVLPAGIARSG